MAAPKPGQPSLTEVMAMLPPCALNCIKAAMVNTTCGSLDNSCRCSDAAYNAQVSKCVLTGCTIRQALTTRNITAGLCNIKPYVNHSGKPIFIIFSALTVIFVGLRFLARRARTVHMWWDDFCSLLSAATVATMLGIMMKLYDLGMGSDMWSIPHENITTIFMYTYLGIFLYGVARIVSRVSIMLFYFRIFENTPGRRLRIAVLVFDVLSCSALVLLGLFPCRPISHFWNKWDGEHQGTCIDFYGEAVGVGVKDIIVDVIIISLPLPYIAKLKLSRRKKIMSCILFSVGLCVIVASAVRVAVVEKFVRSTNPTVDMLDLAILSVVELSLGIVCACLPSVKPLLGSKYIPFLKTTQKGSYAGTHPKYYVDTGKSGGTRGGSGPKEIHVTYTATVADLASTTDGSPLLAHSGVPLTDMDATARESVPRGGSYTHYSGYVSSGSQPSPSLADRTDQSWLDVSMPKRAYIP